MPTPKTILEQKQTLPHRLKTSNPPAGIRFNVLTTTVIAGCRGYVAVTCQLADGVDIHALLQQTGDEGAPHIMWSKPRYA